LEVTRKAYHQSGITVDIQPFFEDMGRRLAEAHLVIARAGASTVAELTVSGRPAILVPYAASLEKDQEANAHWLEQNGGARMILERNFTATHLKDTLLDLMTKKDALKTMAHNMHSLGQPDAAVNLADVLERLVELTK
jgi:UDP-N-acetylglucosamine--N-acetylmuramyl-(pentapeptide) pyrophosphoryl-undecaprenol N-acetylglucosamine transferase